MKRLLLVIALLASPPVNAATMVAPTSCEPPEWLPAIVAGLTRCECVDFSGDGNLDFVALGASSSPPGLSGEVPLGDEFWITSERRVVVSQTLWAFDHRYRWFARLSGRSQPEIISATGFSDGIDYTVQRLDLTSGRFSVLFFFYPVLVETDGHQYHGYPWDLTDILVSGPAKAPRLRAALRPRSQSARSDASDGDGDNEGMPASQRQVPMLFFSGRSTQPDLAALGPHKTHPYSFAALVRATTAH